MPRQTKDESVDIIRELIGEDQEEKLLTCLFNYMSSNELEEFAEFMQDEF